MKNQIAVEKIREKFCSFFMETSSMYGNVITKEALAGIEDYIFNHPHLCFKQTRKGNQKYVRLRKIRNEYKQLAK